jgi:hypothetical protein
MSKTTDNDSTTNKDSIYMGSIPIPGSTTQIQTRFPYLVDGKLYIEPELN